MINQLSGVLDPRATPSSAAGGAVLPASSAPAMAAPVVQQSAAPASPPMPRQSQNMTPPAAPVGSLTGQSLSLLGAGSSYPQQYY